jgi:hypothetical protein
MPDADADRLTEQTQLVVADQPHSIIRGTELLRELIETNAVEILFQPIVDLRTRSAARVRGTRARHPSRARRESRDAAAAWPSNATASSS